MYDQSTVDFFFEVGHLARTPRAGWYVAGIESVESVAEHSHRTAVIAYLLGDMEGADGARACLIGLFHDLPEARSGDRSYLAQVSTPPAMPKQIASDQTAHLEPGIRDALRGLLCDAVDDSSPEAVCANDADKLDCLLRALEYKQLGVQGMDDWVTHLSSTLRTESARRLAGSAKVTSPSRWWREIVGPHLEGLR